MTAGAAIDWRGYRVTPGHVEAMVSKLRHQCDELETAQLNLGFVSRLLDEGLGAVKAAIADLDDGDDAGARAALARFVQLVDATAERREPEVAN